MTKRIIFLLVISLLAGCEQSSAPPMPAAGKVEVGYITLKSQPTPRTIELPGRVVALAKAEIRPQVDGIVRRIAFREGSEVKAGDVLYELDQAKFKATYAAAEATLRKTEAATAGTRSMVARYEELLPSKAVSAQTVDDAHSQLLQDEATEEAAQANLETARINLDNATMRAPIPGLIGVSSVSVGSLVTTNQTDALATIRQVDPIYVDLVDTSANLLRIRDEVDSGQLGHGMSGPPSVKLTLENGKPYGAAGALSLTEMVVSETTGTFTLRATVPNADRVLIPGMFVHATVKLGTTANAFLIPQRAVTHSDDGFATLYVVSADGKAQLKQVTTDGTDGSNWIVVDGVSDGDKLIVDGFQKFSDGHAVDAVEATIGADGVVKQKLGTAPVEVGK
jgi:membrane fusion protein, multidrug efflux system